MAFNLLNLKEKIRAYFNPTSNQGNNFWSSPVAKGLGKAQESLIYRAQNTPRIQLPQIKTGAPVADFGLNLAKAIPESIINIPRNYAVGVGRTGLELGSAIAERRPINIRNLAGGVAPLAESIVDVGTMGFYNPAKTLLKEGVKNVAKQGAKQLIKKGAITGAGFGGFNGLTYGLDEQYNTTATPENFKELLGNIGSGIVLGGVLGGGMAGSGALYGKIKNAVAKVFPNKSGVEQAKIIREFVRDQAGRFAVQGATKKKTPKYISDIRAELGMEKYPDYSVPFGLSVKAKNSAQAGLYDQYKGIDMKASENFDNSSGDLIRNLVHPFDSVKEKLETLAQGKGKPGFTFERFKNLYNPTEEQIARSKVYGIDVPNAKEAWKIVNSKNVAQQPSTKAGLYDVNIKPIPKNASKVGQYALNDNEYFGQVRRAKPETLHGNQYFVDNKIVDQKVADIKAGKPIQPLLVKDGEVIDGFHTAEALTKLGYKEFPVVDIKNTVDDALVAQQPLGEVSNPKGMSKGLKVSVPETGKIEVNTPQPSGISIRTKPNSAVSSVNSITEKGKLNIKNLKIKGAGKKVIQEIEKQTQPTVIGNKEVVKMARTANGTGTMSDEQMTKLMAQQLKNRQKVVDLTVQYNNAKKNGASEVELGKIMLEMVNESRTARQGGTFAGRLLQAQNILAEESASPMQKILALLDNAGVSEEKYLKDAVKVNWDSPNEVVSFYRKYVPAKFGEILDEIRYSNMLSSPLTHIINTVSNALQTGIVAPIEKTVTGTLDWGKSLLTGSERKYYTSSGIDYAGGYIKALPQAFKKAFKVLSGDEILVKPDYERIPTGAKGILKAYTLPLRGLEAMDQFFKTLVEGGVTSELKKAPQKLSLDQISSSATKEANYRLFRQAFDPKGELGQGYVLRYFDKWNSAIANLRRIPGGKWILPFLQTPTNILKQGVEFSPLGFTTAIGAETPIQQISKALIGTTVFVGAYQLASNGLTSWEAPSGEKERELYYAAGMQPYSVKMGDKWVSFSKLGPLSYPIAMAAALADAERQNPDKSKIENIGKSISGMLGFFGDQSYVRSIGELVDAIQGGVNIGATALSSEGANLAGQLVPYKSFLTWLGRMTDPVYRKATTFGEKMIKDLPVVGKTLKPYTDINDNPSVRDFPILNSFSPYKVTQEKDSSAQLLKQYQTKKIEKAVEKRANDKFLQSAEKGDIQVSDNMFKYIDDKGSVKEIDLNFPMPELKTTGDELLDKELLSDYKGELTKLKNSIMEAWEVGAIDQGEAIAQLKKITNATNKTKKAKAPKKISIKRIANRKISINISKSKIKTMPTIKAPKIKISKAKKIRV